MPLITIALTDHAYRALALYASRRGGSIEALAEAAVEFRTSQTREWEEVFPPSRPAGLMLLRLRCDIIRPTDGVVQKRAGECVLARYHDGRPPFVRGWMVEDLGWSLILRDHEVSLIGTADRVPPGWTSFDGSNVP